MQFVPYYELAAVPHVIADGASRRHTALTLSHWPNSGTPWPLKADLSAEIAFRYLELPEHHVDVDAVSNDHLDIDGFITVLALVEPEWALRWKQTLVEVARCGDFATTADVHARRVAFAIDAYTDPTRSPLDPALFTQQRPYQVASLYQALLGEVPAMVEEPDRYAAFWEAEEARVAVTEDAFARGLIGIEEFPDVDLAVVHIEPGTRTGGTHRFCLQGYGPAHPLSVHARSDRFRVLYLQGDRCGLVYRFESWVQFVSRRPAPRVDLEPLARALTAREANGTSWQWAWPQNMNPPVPWLRTEDLAPTAISKASLVDAVVEYLASAPASPDPYDGGGPAAPYGGSSDLVSGR